MNRGTFWYMTSPQIKYAGPLRCGFHTPHLHPRHPPEAGRSRPDHGQLHGTGDVNAENDKNAGEETELPLRCSLGLSGHFRVWVTVWVRRLAHILTHTSFNVLQQKSTENRSFRCFLELLGGFEPPTSSLPSDKMLSSRCGTRVCGHFYRKKDAVENSLFHVFHPFVSPCGSRCGSAPQRATVWVNFWWGENRSLLRCCRQ